MADENQHVRELTTARALAVKARREVANSLSRPGTQGHHAGSYRGYARVVRKLQTMIEAIDRAIEDERQSGGQAELSDALSVICRSMEVDGSKNLVDRQHF